MNDTLSSLYLDDETAWLDVETDARGELTVVGLGKDVQLNAGPSLFVTEDTYVEAIRLRNPDAGTPLPNVIALGAAEGVSDDELVERVNDQSEDLDALTRIDAATGFITTVLGTSSPLFVPDGAAASTASLAVLSDAATRPAGAERVAFRFVPDAA